MLKFANKDVIVIGDTMIDKYTTGSVTRVSQEAPVPIVQIEDTAAHAGAAAHTAAAVAGLGARVHYISVTGKDEAQRELKGIFKAFPKLTSHTYIDAEEATLVRHRIMSRENVMIRLDSGRKLTMKQEAIDYCIAELEKLWPTCDAVIISDYGYGVLDDQIVSTMQRLMRKRKVVLTIDSRNLGKFKNLHPTLVKPNEAETIQLLGLPTPPNANGNIDIFSHEARRLLSLTGSQSVALTIGPRGVLCIDRPDKVKHVAPPFVSKLQESGAGDSFIAAATLSLASGVAFHEAAHFANSVAAISIEKGSTGVCTPRDLENIQTPRKVVSLKELLLQLENKRDKGQTIVFTNGCFDLLHPGHVKLLDQAKTQGDVLVVGINTDASVRKLKGKTRPINSLEDRGAVLAGLQAVDYVVAFAEDTPEALIDAIKPDVFVKAGYSLSQLPEAPTIRKHRGRIVLFDTIPGSTTEIITRIKQ
jgi:D-beta-D-heptose 7-phosphate kinase/D-beta-D-heptose 1-phosphate adenosyltransferase